MGFKSPEQYEEALGILRQCHRHDLWSVAKESASVRWFSPEGELIAIADATTEAQRFRIQMGGSTANVVTVTSPLRTEILSACTDSCAFDFDALEATLLYGTEAEQASVGAEFYRFECPRWANRADEIAELLSSVMSNVIDEAAIEATKDQTPN